MGRHTVALSLLAFSTGWLAAGSGARAQAEAGPTAASPVLGETPSPFAELGPDLAAVVPELVATMRAGLLRTEPNSSRWYTSEGGALFVGSYDWHSNVIAHWSLLTIARLTGDTALSAEIAGRLNGDALFAERELLERLDHTKRATFPYDLAWLGMLLRELEHHAPDEDLGEIDALRAFVETTVLAHLEAGELPDLPPRRSDQEARYCGYYRSWLFAHLLCTWSEPIGEETLETLDRLRNERLAPHRAAIAAQLEPHPFDFLWVPAVLALLDRSGPLPEDEHPYPLQEFAPLPETVSLRDVHVVGLELSKLWPYAWDAHSQVAGARAAYQSRLKEVLARRDLWVDDFTVVAHWVPQYVWITLWLALGRP